MIKRLGSGERAVVSCAISGETSSDTQPSTLSVWA
jgi:hypothetical protein